MPPAKAVSLWMPSSFRAEKVANATKQSPGYAKLFPRIASSHSLAAIKSSARVEDEAGDNEHCRYRQHLRERLRGRPPSGVRHAILLRPQLPRPGRDSSLPAKAPTIRF